MSQRSRNPFRFDPPRLEATPDLRWVLLRAFGPIEATAPLSTLREPLRLAEALGLAPRIAARHDGARLAREIGPAAAAELARRRAETAARELRLDLALAAADGALSARGARYALLKGRALALGGFAPAAGRPAADVDLLVPEARLPELQRALLGAGFRAPADAAYEHQAPLLLHAGGGALELHRTLPGLRLDGRRSATLEHLERAGLLRPLRGPGDEAAEVPREPLALHGDARLPAREVLIAHALVHTLAQHAFVAAHAGFQMVADLIDLGCASVVATEAAVLRWIEGDVSAAEVRAALELTDDVAAGELSFLDEPGSHAGRLAAHFVACAGDPAYGTALKARLFELPLSDRPRWLARLLLLLTTLSPPGGGGVSRRLRRPFELAGRWRASRRAARESARPRPR